MKPFNETPTNGTIKLFLKELCPEITEDALEKSLDFLELLNEFDQQANISQIGDFLKEKGYLLYGTKLLIKKKSEMLSEEEKEKVKNGELLLGFKHLFQNEGKDNDFNEFHIVLAYEKPRQVDKTIGKIKGCIGGFLGDKIAA